MLRLDLIRGRPVHVPLRVMEAEAALLLTAARFFVSVEIRAPDALRAQLRESRASSASSASGAMRRPRRAYHPVADLQFSGLCALRPRREKAAAAAQLAVPPSENRERPRRGEDGADDLAAFFYVLMDVPAGRRADVRILRQFIERLCVRFLPRTELQARCLQFHRATFFLEL